MKDQYDYKFQNFDEDENNDPPLKKTQPTFETKDSIDQDSTKPMTEFSTSKFQTEYLEKVKLMESLINTIKQNAFEKRKKELENKLRIKNELENNVEILSNYIKMNRTQKRNFGSLSKSITKENERLTASSQRAMEEQYFIQRELPSLRSEINQMQSQIGKLNNETKNLKNEKLAIERDIMYLQDEIKRMNKMNSSFFSEKENIRSSIKLLKKHSGITREKINIQNNKSDEFFNSLTYLAMKSQYENEEYEKRNKRFDTLCSSTTASLINESLK